MVFTHRRSGRPAVLRCRTLSRAPPNPGGLWRVKPYVYWRTHRINGQRNVRVLLTIRLFVPFSLRLLPEPVLKQICLASQSYWRDTLFSSSLSTSLSNLFPDSDADRCVDVRVNWTGEAEAAWAERLSAGGSGAVTGVLRAGGVPARLADALAAAAGLPPGRNLAELRKAERLGLLAALTACPLACDGHEGYVKVRG